MPVSHQLAESVTGIIGLKESVATKQPIIKYIWTFLFCLGIGATVFFVYGTANEYLSEPTLTKVSFQVSSTNFESFSHYILLLFRQDYKVKIFTNIRHSFFAAMHG